MPLEPPFWYRRHHLLGWLLAPLGRLYGGAVQMRFAVARPYRSRLPVICIGNFTMGGAGKTPLAIHIAGRLREAGHKPVFLSRGFGGSIREPHLVDTASDTATEVGDEPLLLARHAPAVVSADRAAGARYIERLDADVIVMDDGFQNPQLDKDLSLVVVDAERGFGNGHVFPAGPLRAALSFQLPRADAVVVNSRIKSWPAPLAASLSSFRGERLTTKIESSGDVGWIAGARVLAVAGIAHPAKFHATLSQLGAVVAESRSFPDHHRFSDQEIAGLLALAEREQLALVMTEKDHVRLPDEGMGGKLKALARTLAIRLAVDDAGRLDALLQRPFRSKAVDRS